jgi:hypothetical protein
VQRFFKNLPEEDQKRTLLLMQKNEILSEQNQ